MSASPNVASFIRVVVCAVYLLQHVMVKLLLYLA